MAEPTSTTTSVGLYGLFVALFGSIAGEYALIIFAALAGGFWAVSTISTENKVKAGIFLIKIVFTAIVLTGAVAAFLELKFGWPVKQVIAPAAFIIGFMGNKWPQILNRVLNKFLPGPGK